MSVEELNQEIAKRRTFAIISHPDAGKTTLTEKLLLYGGAIHLAGSIKSRKTQHHGAHPDYRPGEYPHFAPDRGIQGKGRDGSVKKFVLIYNPVSGKAAFKSRLDSILEAFQQRDCMTLVSR